MKFSTSAILCLAPSAAAFMMMPGGNNRNRVLPTNAATLTTPPPVNEAKNDRPIYDPLGLYPPSSPERRDGRIQALSEDPDSLVINEISSQRPIYDPLGLYPPSSEERRNHVIQELLGSEQAVMFPKATADPLNLYPANAMAVKAELQEQMAERPLYDPFVLYGPSSPERQEGRIQFATDEADTELIQQWNSDRPLYDPLTLYPESSDERRNNRIQVLEAEQQDRSVQKAVVDPLQLYPTGTVVQSFQADMSQALPFMTRPAVLDGTLPGDAGFDPLGFASNQEKLLFLRDAELKHSRIAMLAAAGWPLSELWNNYLASLTHLKPLLGLGDRVPSVLNGGLDKVSPLFWVAVVGTASLIEIINMVQTKTNDDPQQQESGSLLSNPAVDLESLQLSEIKNGRIAMLAITAFAMQEFVTKMAVVNLSPFFFHPFH